MFKNAWTESLKQCWIFLLYFHVVFTLRHYLCGLTTQIYASYNPNTKKYFYPNLIKFHATHSHWIKCSPRPIPKPSAMARL